jgi:hypothetical protein
MDFFFRIEKNIPIPKGHTVKIAYPFQRLRVKDSFFVPLKVQAIENVRAAACSRGKSLKWKFKVAKYYQPTTKDGFVLGCRVWRVA